MHKIIPTMSQTRTSESLLLIGLDSPTLGVNKKTPYSNMSYSPDSYISSSSSSTAVSFPSLPFPSSDDFVSEFDASIPIKKHRRNNAVVFTCPFVGASNDDYIYSR
jgi:hypothetical protein